jgi:hypothetical protein
MAEENRESLKPELAIALAQGVSVIRWARENDVPRTTAYRWAGEPEVRKIVETCRRRVIDRAIGRMTKRSTWVVDRITRLADKAESEAVRLRALRGMLSDMMSVSKYSGLEGRVAEVEEQFYARAQSADAQSADGAG